MGKTDSMDRDLKSLELSGGNMMFLAFNFITPADCNRFILKAKFFYFYLFLA